MSSDLQNESSSATDLEEMQTIDDDDGVDEEVPVYVPSDGILSIQLVGPDFLKEFAAVKQPRIHRILPHMRGDSRNQGLYDPVVLSIGPYHHGKQQFCQLEKYKEVALNWFMSDCSQEHDEDFFRGKIVRSINDIRSMYEEVACISNEDLANIILRDACFVVNYLKGFSERSRLSLGMSTIAFINNDIYMLENQIPFWVIMFLLDSRYGKHDAREIVCKHLRKVCCNDQLERLPWGNGVQPHHLLEAFQITCARQHAKVDESTEETRLHFLTNILKWMKNHRITGGCINSNSSESSYGTESFPFRSVTNLQAHGIYFEPSSSCLKDIRFTSYQLCGKLQLPIWFVRPETKVFFSNIIAFEMSRGDLNQCTVASYINFMKSLIENPKDVKELRKKGILFSSLGNDEEVVKLFKQLNTYGLNNSGIFAKERWKIDKHCNSKARTWMAELVRLYFCSPWTTTGLIAAAFLLGLTFLQTYYTIRP